MMFSTATWPPAPSGKDLRKGVGLKTIMTAMGEAVAEIGAMTRAAFLVYLGLANGIAPSVTSAFHAKTVWGPIVFRRKIGARVWHSSPECFSWPKTNFEEKEHPTIGRRCSNCWAIEDAKAQHPVNQAKPDDPQ
jgi:hypothetical protein